MVKGEIVGEVRGQNGIRNQRWLNINSSQSTWSSEEGNEASIPDTIHQQTFSIHVKFRQRLSRQGFALFSGKHHVSHFPAWYPQAWRRYAHAVLQQITLCWNKFLVAAARFLCTFSNHCVFIHLDSTLFTDKNTEETRGFLICLSHSFISLTRMVSIECILCVGHSPSF